VANLSDCFRRVQEVDLYRIPKREHGLHKARIAPNIREMRALAPAPETAHSVLHISEETLARLLAIIADVYSAFRLHCHHLAVRVFDLPLHDGSIDRLVAA